MPPEDVSFGLLIKSQMVVETLALVLRVISLHRKRRPAGTALSAKSSLPMSESTLFCCFCTAASVSILLEFRSTLSKTVQVIFTQGGVERPSEKIIIQVVYKPVQSIIVAKNPF